MPPRPEVKALLLCDMVIRDQGSNKWSAIGIFDNINVLRLPAVQPTLGIYVKLADAHGQYELTIAIRHVESQELVAKLEGIRVEVRDRARAADFGFMSHQLVLSRLGPYDIELWLNKELCQTATFTVQQMAPPAPPPVAEE
jgi:hypothetical protein